MPESELPAAELTLLPSSERLWFAVRVRSNFERTSSAILNGKGYETYVPFYRELRRWSDRATVAEVPLFPGYVFSRFDVERKLPILTTPGVVHIVPPHRMPAPVDEEEIKAVRLAVESGLPVGPHPFLQAGQRVVVRRGAMTGLEGILLEARRNFRLVISITLLQRSVAVEIDRDWVRPLDSGPAHPAQIAPSSQPSELRPRFR